MQEILKIGDYIRFKQDYLCGYRFGFNLAYKTLGQITGKNHYHYIINILNNKNFLKDRVYDYELDISGYSFPIKEFNLNAIEILPKYSNTILYLMFPNI